jgi:hypothetical protein
MLPKEPRQVKQPVLLSLSMCQQECNYLGSLGSMTTHCIDYISCHAAQGAKASKSRAAILIVSVTNKKVLALAPWVV